MNAAALRIPRDARGRDRYFGRFENCAFFDQPCAVVVTDATTGSLVRDALGAVMRVGDLAIHVSGFGPNGRETGPGFVKALGHYSVDWLGKEHRGAGFGFDRAEGACIATWDDATIGTHHNDGWQHVAYWSAADSYISTAGVLSIAHDGLPFDAKYVVNGVNEVKRERREMVFPSLFKQHERVARRLLEALVGVSNQPSLQERPWFHLERVGRWRYRWTNSERDAALARRGAK